LAKLNKMYLNGKYVLPLGTAYKYFIAQMATINNKNANKYFQYQKNLFNNL